MIVSQPSLRLVVVVAILVTALLGGMAGLTFREARRAVLPTPTLIPAPTPLPTYTALPFWEAGPATTRTPTPGRN